MNKNILLIIYIFLIILPNNISYSKSYFWNAANSFQINFNNNQIDTLRIDSLKKSAENYFTNNELDSSLVVYEKLKELYLASGKIEDVINTLNQIADIYYRNGKYDSALIVLKNAVTSYQNNFKKENLLFIKTKIKIAAVLLRLGKLNEALQTATETTDKLNILPDKKEIELAENYFVTGMIYYQMSDYNKSLEFHLKALNIRKNELGENHSSVGSSYNSIASIYNIKGDYENALEYYFRSLQIKIKEAGENTIDVSSLYNNIGSAYFAKGENDLAIEYYLKSLMIKKNILDKENPGFAFTYNNLAMAYRINEDFGNALSYGKLALDIFIKRLGAEHPNVAGVINNIGRTYFDIKDYDKALDSYNNALQIFLKKYGENHSTTAQNIFNIGEIYFFKKEYNTAIDFINKSLEIRKNIFGEFNEKVSQSYLKLSEIYLAQNEREQYDFSLIDSALFFIQKSIFSITKNSLDTIKYNIPDFKNISFEKDLLNSIIVESDMYYQKYLYQYNDINDLKFSLRLLESAVELTEKIRRGYKSEQVKFNLNKNIYSLYEKGIKIALTLFDITKNEQYKNSAFMFADKSKAGILIDEIYDINAKSYGDIPDSLLMKEKQLRIDLTYLDTEIQKMKVKYKNETNENLSSIPKYHSDENELFKLRREYDLLIDYFEKNFNKYYQLRFQPQIVNVNDIQILLKENNTSVIEYFLSDSLLYFFIIKSDDFIIKSFPLDKSLNERIINFRRALKNLYFEQYITEAYNLYKILFLPIENEISNSKKLYLITDGILNYLPFEILISGRIQSQINNNVSKSNNIDFANLPYLLNNYEISYHYSSALLAENLMKEETKDLSFVGFAPVFSVNDSAAKFDSVYMNFTNQNNLFRMNIPAENINRDIQFDGKNYSVLKESERELLTINELFRNKNKNTKIYLHKDAKEENIKSVDIKQFNNIHLATHGFINEEKPKLSGLIFSDVYTNSSEDGILNMEEILNLQLNADLVVLSSCESGLGKVMKGEGIMALTRSFLYAGTKNLIVSLWKVDDKSTTELIINLYKNILDNQSLSAALRKAKLNLIKEGKYSYPLDWGAFVLIGG